MGSSRRRLLNQSTHAWLAGRAPLDLIVTMDDASSEIYSAFLVEEEGTMSSFSGLLAVIAEQGLPCALYTDRASHCFHTPEAGGKVDKSKLTQVGRALDRLGIEHIPAYSPEARGRSERAFATLQDRLVKELALAAIATVEAANRFIAETYLPDHNTRFARPPEVPESVFVPTTRAQVEDILRHQEARQVGNDNTVRYHGRILQIPEHDHCPHVVKARVRVHEYPDGTLAVFHGPRRLARFSAQGRPIDTKNLAA